MKPLVSIVIPVFDRVPIFARSLQSVMDQTYPSIEIIVVNDGGSKEIAEIVAQYPGTVYLAQQNKGAAVARNTGLAIAKGEYVLCCDADVIARPEMVATMVDALQEHDEVSYVYSAHKLGWKTFPALPFSVKRLKEFNYISTMALVRKEDHPGFDETLDRFQDWDVWLTMLEKNKRGLAIDSVLFTTLPGGTMSAWVPSFWYKLFPKSKIALAYARARAIIIAKHNLPK